MLLKARWTVNGSNIWLDNDHEIALALRADRIEMKQSFWVFSFIYSIDIYLTHFSEGGYVSTAFIMHLSL
jgi:hypothetical protein